ncbi:MAG: spore maturation protein [Lachnospiraceae bacterium]
MKFFLYITDMIIPMMIFGIICYGCMMKVDVYDTFIKGAKNGFFTVIKIMPTLIGLMVAVGVLRASGFLDFLAGMIGNFSKYIGFPGELVPLTIVKMFSSSAATGLLLDTYKEYGTDSLLGLIASISMACTETIFYTMSVYFITAKVSKTRYTLTGALLATFAGLAASVILAQMMLGTG